MANGKIRSEKHILGEQAVMYIQNDVIPAEWVVRQMNPDYGIDLDLELFDYDNNQCITLGEHLFMQVKGTKSPNYGKMKVEGGNIDVIKYQLEVDELELVEKMGSAFPVLLVIVDLNKPCAYQICLNDYIKLVLPNQKPNYKMQKSVIINIPLENEVSSANIDSLKWYSKRIKLYSMFHEMLVDIEDSKYMQNEQYVECGKKFVEYYRKYNVLKSCPAFITSGLLEKMDYLYFNDFISEEGIIYTQCVLDNKEDWENGVIYIDSFSDKTIPARLFAQIHSIQQLYKFIINCSGIFETYSRQWYMPELTLGVCCDKSLSDNIER